MHELSGYNIKYIAADGAVSAATALPANAIGTVTLTAGAGAAATLVVYDGTGTGGTKLMDLTALQGTSVSVWLFAALNAGNVYCDIGGAGASCTVTWK